MSNSAVDFPEDIDNTSKFLAENESLRCKIEHFELENKKLNEKNIKFKSHIYNFDNTRIRGRIPCCKWSNSWALMKFLNPGEDSCNIKFSDTSSRLSQSCDDTGSPKSGPKLKLSSQDQLFMYITWLKMDLLVYI